MPAVEPAWSRGPSGSFGVASAKAGFKAAMSTDGISLRDIEAPPITGMRDASRFAAPVSIGPAAPLGLTAGMSRADLAVAGIIIGLFSVVFVIDLLTPAERAL